MNIKKFATQSRQRGNEKFEKNFSRKRTFENITDNSFNFKRTVLPKTSNYVDDKENRVKIPILKHIKSQSNNNSKLATRTPVQNNFEHYRRNSQQQNTERRVPNKSTSIIARGPESQRARSQSFKPPMNKQKPQKIPPKKLFSQLLSKVINFGQNKDLLLSNLDGVFQELTRKEIEENSQKAEYEAKEVQLIQKKKSQSEQLKSLVSRIRALEQHKQKLEEELDKKNLQLRGCEDKLRARDKILTDVGRLVNDQESELNKITQKKCDLINSVQNLDAAIVSIKQKSKDRYYDLCNEQRKTMVIQELLHLKKKQPRKILFLQSKTTESVEMVDESEKYKGYSAQLLTDGRKLIIDLLQKTSEKKSPKLVELDSVYEVKQFPKLDLNENCQLDQLKSFFSTAIQSGDTNKNFNFFFLIQDVEAWNFMKSALNLFCSGKLEEIDHLRKIYVIRFQSDGTILSEEIIDDEGKLSCVGYSKSNTVFTFALKGNSSADSRIVSIYSILQKESLAIDFVHKMMNKAAASNQNVLAPVEYTPGQHSIEPFLRESLSASNSFAIGIASSMISDNQDKDKLNEHDSTQLLLENIQKLGTIICNNRLNKKY